MTTVVPDPVHGSKGPVQQATVVQMAAIRYRLVKVAFAVAIRTSSPGFLIS